MLRVCCTSDSEVQAYQSDCYLTVAIAAAAHSCSQYSIT